MVLVAEWQGELGAFTFGAGMDWWVDEPGISGLGAPVPTDSTSARGNRDGEVAGEDVLPRRLLTIPLACGFATAGEAWVSLETEVKQAWTRSASDVELDLLLPGMTESRRFYGRPRGLDVDLVALKSGTIRALATFHALDPLGYGAEETDTGNTGTFVINNAGTAPTDRVTITVTGNSGTPVLVNETDEGRTVRFGTTVTGTRTLDLRGRTVQQSGQDVYAELSPTSQWFELVPGNNTLTLTGAASVDVTWRPAWY